MLRTFSVASRRPVGPFLKESHLGVHAIRTLRKFYGSDTSKGNVDRAAGSAGLDDGLNEGSEESSLHIHTSRRSW